MTHLTRERFLRDVADHQMSVDLDQGVHRHLKFRRVNETGKTSGLYWFDVVTWPGSLAIVGDCGAFVFSRLTDMFQFFRSDGGRINPQYWSEKLRAIDAGHRPGSDGYGRHYSYERFVERVNEWRDDQWDEWQRTMDEIEREFERYEETPLFAGTRRRRRQRRARDEVRRAFFAAVHELVADEWGDLNLHHSEEAAHSAVARFHWRLWSIPYDEEFRADLRHPDTWEWDFRTYDHRLLWNCHAIVYAIEQYDHLRASNLAVAA